MKQSNYLNFKNHHIYVGLDVHSLVPNLPIGNVSRLGTSPDWERLSI